MSVPQKFQQATLAYLELLDESVQERIERTAAFHRSIKQLPDGDEGTSIKAMIEDQIEHAETVKKMILEHQDQILAILRVVEKTFALDSSAPASTKPTANKPKTQIRHAFYKVLVGFADTTKGSARTIHEAYKKTSAEFPGITEATFQRYLSDVCRKGLLAKLTVHAVNSKRHYKRYYLTKKGSCAIDYQTSKTDPVDTESIPPWGK